MASQRAIDVLVLGGTGMLGSMVVDVLSRVADVRVRTTHRRQREVPDSRFGGGPIEWVPFDVGRDAPESVLAGQQWIINAIGIIKPLIREEHSGDIERAVVVNAVFPFVLAAAAAKTNARVIQIATDCVYSGRTGQYREDSPHDALDVYGKTKSLGEVPASHFLNLRCSIVGPELSGQRSLLNWFIGQPIRATVRGFVNHRWNGITTLHFAQIALGLVRSGSILSGTHHIVPGDAVTKAQLLREFAVAFDRSDVSIEDAEAPDSIDRTLATATPAVNEEIWRASGRTDVPSVRDLIKELGSVVRSDPAQRQDAATR